MPVAVVKPFLEAIASGADVSGAAPPAWQLASAPATKAATADAPLYFLDAELRPISISTACGISAGSGFGLTRGWAERLSEAAVDKRQALLVQRLSPRVRAKGGSAHAALADAALRAGAGANGKGNGSGSVDGNSNGGGSGGNSGDGLQEGDLLLAIDGTPVATFIAVEQCVARKATAALTILRDGREHTIVMPLSKVASDGTVHIVMWSGLVVQEAYRSVLERGFEPPEGGVYISYYLFGSPAHKHKLVPKNWIVELNGQVVADLSGFVRLIQQLRHGAPCRVKTVDLSSRISVFTVKTDHNYWRSYEVRRVGGEWVQTVLPEPE